MNLHLHRVAEQRHDHADMQAVADWAAEQERVRAALRPDREMACAEPDDQSQDAGIGSVLWICAAFLGFSCLCVWLACAMAGVPLGDVMREIWRAGSPNT